jgi:transketolase
MTGPSPELREQIANAIRFLAVDAVEKARSGHPGAPMGLAGPAFELWDEHLRFDPTDPGWPLRDRFVLSAGHASMLLYSLLHLYGYDLPLEEIENFRQLHARTAGHPEYGLTPGVELTTGPLGQGFAHGVGMALAARMTRARFGRDGEGPGHHRVYAIVSDGDLMEGVSAEAGSLAGHLGLGNLIYLYDDNRVTIDGPTDLSFSEDVAQRFEAQRWHVQRVDGLDADGLRKAFEEAKAEAERPSLIVCRTTIGYGAPSKGGTAALHGAPLGSEEAEATKRALGWPTEPAFHVPDAVRAYFAERAAAKRAERGARDERLARWRDAHPDLAAEWERFRRREVPADLAERLAEGMAEATDATRKHSGVVIQRLAEVAPFVVGGSADLTDSNNTLIAHGGVVGPAAGEGIDPFAGRNIYFGVREHAMAAIANGLALDGTFLPFAGTFLVFSDYMRPSLRLSALMGVRVIFVFTHDSIFLGEDGPTHQPIEQLDALRALPNFIVFRPADGLETAAAWTWLVQRAEGPGMLALTRQKVPALERPDSFRLEDVWKGGYAVRETEGDPGVVLVATGSEVGLSCEAAEKLSSRGVAARVVSLPSLELFERQSESYRSELIPAEAIPVVAVEAARGRSLRPLVGTRGLVYGIETFGASAPAGRMAEEFGFTPDRLAAAVSRHLEKVGAAS